MAMIYLADGAPLTKTTYKCQMRHYASPYLELLELDVDDPLALPRRHQPGELVRLRAARVVLAQHGLLLQAQLFIIGINSQLIRHTSSLLASTPEKCSIPLAFSLRSMSRSSMGLPVAIVVIRSMI